MCWLSLNCGQHSPSRCAWCVLCLFCALNRGVGAFLISIIITSVCKCAYSLLQMFPSSPVRRRMLVMFMFLSLCKCIGLLTVPNVSFVFHQCLLCLCVQVHKPTHGFRLFVVCLLFHCGTVHCWSQLVSLRPLQLLTPLLCAEPLARTDTNTPTTVCFPSLFQLDSQAVKILPTQTIREADTLAAFGRRLKTHLFSQCLCSTCPTH